jgi:hypothetical protein
MCHRWSHIVLATFGQRRINIAVNQQQWNSSLLGLHHSRDQRLIFTLRQQDHVNFLRDHRADVGNLLCGRTGSVGIDQLPATFCGFILHALSATYHFLHCPFGSPVDLTPAIPV